MAPRVNTARLGRGGVRISDIDFVWNEVGYRKMQRQPAIMAYMSVRAERLAQEMRELTSGPRRTRDQYRENDDYSQSYPIGTSRNHTLRNSIQSRGPIGGPSRDLPYSFNVGPYRYRGPNNLTGLQNIEIQRFGNGRQQGRDFIAQAVRNTMGRSLRSLS